MLLALVAGALAADPILGPAGWTWLGPVPPGDPPDTVVLDATTCAAEVARVDLDGGPENRDVRLARVWADGAWRWADDWRVTAGWLERPGHAPVPLDGPRFGEDVLRVDAAGRVTARVRAGRTVEILRDPAGAFTGMRSGAVEVRVDRDRGVASDGREVRWRRENGELRSVADGDGVVAAYGYVGGALARVTWADGSAVAIETVGGRTRVSGVGGTWRCEVRSAGRVSVEGPGGGWLVEGTGAPRRDGAETVTDPTGGTTRVAWVGGRLAGWTDPRGGETRIARDGRGRVATVDDPTGARWTLGWNDTGLTTVTGADGATWSLTRTAAGAVTRVAEPSGRAATFERDPAGRLRGVRIGASAWAVLRDAAGRATAVIDPVGSKVELLRGPDGRVGKIRDGSGGAWTIGRDGQGRVTTVSDPGQGTWTIERDPLGRPVAVTEPTGARTRWTLRDDGLPARVYVAGRHAWDLLWSAAGALAGIRDPAGHTTGLPRDPLGHARAVHRPDGEVVPLGRDAAGDIVRVGDLSVRRDAAGRPLGVDGVGLDGVGLAWDRDVQGRVVGVTGPGVGLALAREPGGALRTVAIVGSAPITLTRDAQGRVVRAEGPRGTTLTRDAAGRVTSVRSTRRPTVRIDRDVRGLPARVVLPDTKGAAWTYGRDAAGRVVRVEGPGGVRLGVDRDAAGRPTLARFSAGALARFVYDVDAVTVAITDRSDAVRARASWLFGPTGTLDRLQAGAVWLLRRDPLGALVAAESADAVWSSAPDGVEGPGGASVRYDASGRPVAAVSTDGAAWGLGAGELRYTRGPDGGVTAISGPRGRVDLAWDGVGRLVGWSGPGGGQRVERDADGTLAVEGVEGFAAPLIVGGRPVAAVDGVGVAEGDGGVLVGPLDSPLVALADLAGSLAPRLLPWAPSGPTAAEVPTTGANGRFPLGNGARVGLLDAIDPVTGAPLGPSVRWPWDRRGWEATPGVSPWPDPDGAADVPWDNAAWAPASPWHDPLALLVAAGDLPDGGPRATRAPGLPWLPASLAPTPPAPVPDALAFALDDDPVVAWIVDHARAPTRAAEPSDLARLFVGDLVAAWLDVPPGLGPALPRALGGP